MSRYILGSGKPGYSLLFAPVLPITAPKQGQLILDFPLAKSAVSFPLLSPLPFGIHSLL